MARLKQQYQTEMVGKLCEQFSIKNKMAAPKLDKITLNVGMGQAKNEPKRFDTAQSVLGKITGQKPVINKARLSVSNFKLREGDPVGCKVTLRGQRMYEFLDRLVNVSMPRIRDFRGFSRKSFDKHGHYSLGLQEQSIFPELKVNDLEQVFGMDITFTFKHSDPEKSLALMEHMGFPFKKK